MADQGKEGIDIKLRKNSVAPADSNTVTSKQRKCKQDDAGKCKSRPCVDYHAPKTCQAHSKFGQCPLESSCEHRHPHGVCYHWEQYGSCFKEDSCRFRHPLEFTSRSDFLGRNSPGRNQESPKYRYHDLRGNRW